MTAPIPPIIAPPSTIPNAIKKSRMALDKKVLTRNTPFRPSSLPPVFSQQQGKQLVLLMYGRAP